MSCGGHLCRQQSHCPAAKSGPPGQPGQAALCTVGGAITRGSHRLSPPGDTVPALQQQRPGPCCGPPSTRWVLALWSQPCPGCRGSATEMPLFGWAPVGAPAAVLASPRGVLLCWHIPAWLRSVVSHPQPQLPTSPCLQRALCWPTAEISQYPSPLLTALGFLHGPDHVEAASCSSPACSSRSPKHHRCTQEPRHRLQQTCVTTLRESTALPCPWMVAFLFCGGRGTSQSSKNGTLPSQLSSHTPQLYSMALGGGHLIQNLKFPGPGHQGSAAITGAGSTPCPCGHCLVHMEAVQLDSVQSVGLGAFRAGS